MKIKIFFLSAICIALCSCNGRTRGGADRPDTIAMQPCPTFQSDSAMQSIVTQCEFGPRVPGSDGWKRCGQWIADQFKALGLQVEEQNASVTAYDGSSIPCKNIIARLNPENKDRILLCAHWDSRPWADNDPNEMYHKTPILAANDGASGVAVMLELARVMTRDSLKVKTGIDFICFDAEDYGTPQWAENDSTDTSETWCLGSTFWARQAVENQYRARFGILFDMVGGRGSTFAMEGVSKEYAEPVVQMLWHIAHQIGYGHYFPLTDGGYMVDDHVPVNRIAHVPCVDIIPYHTDGPSNFGPTWHTMNDTPENIDTNVLEAVGQSVLQLIYNDNAE